MLDPGARPNGDNEQLPIGRALWSPVHMSTYSALLRAYSLVIVAAILLAVAFNATPQAQSLDELAGWETLPDSCSAPLTCSGNNP